MLFIREPHKTAVFIGIDWNSNWKQLEMEMSSSTVTLGDTTIGTTLVFILGAKI